MLSSDRAAAFIGKVFKNLTDKFGIKHIVSSSQHAQSQGLVERANRVILSALRCLPESDQKWDLHIPSISLALKSTPSKALGGYTSFEIVTGRKCRVPEQHNVMGSVGSASTTGGSFDQEMIHLQESLSLSQKFISEAREKYFDSMKSTYDRNAKLQIFNVGDKVLRTRQYFDLKKTPKLMSRLVGPYEIVEKQESFNTYRLKDLQTNKIQPNFTHVCKLKPYRERTPENSFFSDQVGSQTPQHLTTDNEPITDIGIEPTPTPQIGRIPDTDRSVKDSFNQQQPESAHHDASEISLPPTNQSEHNRASPTKNPADMSCRRSARIQDKMNEILKTNQTNYDRPKFYGTAAQTYDVQKDSSFNEPPVNLKQGILKKSVQSKGTPEHTPRFALFRIPGRPTDGNIRTTKIPILRVLHAKKRYNGMLEFHVELATTFKNTKFAWVNEHEIYPPLEGVRSERYPFVHKPHLRD